MAYKTNLSNNDATFASMMENGFGIVTVMNPKVYEAMPEEYLNKTAYQVIEFLKTQEAICELDTLKIANVTQEGPTKTITGGKYSNALVKFGKSARLEMQDALGSAKAIEYLCGGIREWTGGLNNYVNGLSGLHFGEDFQGPKTIGGESFFIDRVTGKQVDVSIIFYQFSPDSIFNLTQDAEGDATVFDMNGDLLTTEILLGTDKDEEPHGVFYSILPATPGTPSDPGFDPEPDPERETETITITLDAENLVVLDDYTVRLGEQRALPSTYVPKSLTFSGAIHSVKNGGITINISNSVVYYQTQNDLNYKDAAILNSKDITPGVLYNFAYFSPNELVNFEQDSVYYSENPVTITYQVYKD